MEKKNKVNKVNKVFEFHTKCMPILFCFLLWISFQTNVFPLHSVVDYLVGTRNRADAFVIFSANSSRSHHSIEFVTVIESYLFIGTQNHRTLQDNVRACLRRCEHRINKGHSNNLHTTSTTISIKWFYFSFSAITFLMNVNLLRAAVQRLNNHFNEHIAHFYGMLCLHESDGPGILSKCRLIIIIRVEFVIFVLYNFNIYWMKTFNGKSQNMNS